MYKDSPPTVKFCPAPNVSGAAAEEPCLRGKLTGHAWSPVPITHAGPQLALSDFVLKCERLTLHHTFEESPTVKVRAENKHQPNKKNNLV